MNRPRSARPLVRPGVRLHSRSRGLGFSLIELMLVVGIVATMSAATIPALTRALERYRTLGAVRYVSSRLQRARAAAVARGANVAVRFGPFGSVIAFTTYADGNRNGVSSADIVTGVDPEVLPASDLSGFGGVEFGVLVGIPSPDGGTISSGDPIRFGTSRMASFTPQGTATPGSVYIKGRGGSQFAIRVYGDTGKAHILRFDPGQRRWVPL